MKPTTYEWLTRAAEDLAAAQLLLCLTRLYELVRPHYPAVSDMDMLDRLDAVYIEARCPGDMGLLPTGKPTPDEAASLLGFADDVFQRLRVGLQSPVSKSATGDSDA